MAPFFEVLMDQQDECPQVLEAQMVAEILLVCQMAMV
jgi:hypothetical protein